MKPHNVYFIIIIFSSENSYSFFDCMHAVCANEEVLVSLCFAAQVEVCATLQCLRAYHVSGKRGGIWSVEGSPAGVPPAGRGAPARPPASSVRPAGCGPYPARRRTCRGLPRSGPSVERSERRGNEAKLRHGPAIQTRVKYVFVLGSNTFLRSCLVQLSQPEGLEDQKVGFALFEKMTFNRFQ